MAKDRQFRGFDEAFLREFAQEQQRLADELERKADDARIAAHAALSELNRRAQAA
jgi:hypothetical protein